MMTQKNDSNFKGFTLLPKSKLNKNEDLGFIVPLTDPP